MFCESSNSVVAVVVAVLAVGKQIIFIYMYIYIGHANVIIFWEINNYSCCESVSLKYAHELGMIHCRLILCYYIKIYPSC